MPWWQHRLAKAAVHEAGHAAAQLLCADFSHVVYATVDPELAAAGAGADTQGDTAILLPAVVNSNQARRYIPVMLAGATAEKLFFGKADSGSLPDCAEAEALLEQVLPGGSHADRTELAGACWDEAHKLVTERQHAIATVARTLVERRTLNHDELAALLRNPCADDLPARLPVPAGRAWVSTSRKRRAHEHTNRKAA